MNNSSMRKKLFVDLTDLEKWSGIHGGIQRVVYGIAKEFYLAQEDDFDVVFVSFDSEQRLFRKSSFEPVYKRVERLNALENFSENESVSKSVRRGVLDGAKQKLVKIISKKLTTTNDIAPTSISVNAGDIILIMGMSWESEGMQMALSEYKDKHGAMVTQVVYDLIISLYPHLHHPDNYGPYTDNITGVINSSDLLLPISQSSARDVEKFAHANGLVAPRMEVIRLGDELAWGVSKIPNTHKEIKKDFILCVGTIEIRKNHTLLYYVYKLAKEQGIRMPQLVIVGGSGWFTGDIQYLLSTDPAIQDEIVVLNDIEDDGLRWLYENCQFTVYPSMYEGWGLPIAESLAYGKVCLASKSSSMTEIGGDLIDYFSPFDTAECLEKIVKFINKDVLTAAEKEIKGKYIITTWKDTYTQVIDRLSHIL